MRVGSAIVSVLSVSLIMAAGEARAQYRGGTGYGGTTGGYGSGSTGGSSGGYGNNRNNTPTFVTPSTTSSSSTGNDSSDYANAMKSVDSSTKQAFGAPMSDDDAEKAAKKAADAKAKANASGTTVVQPSISTLPNAAGGYNAQLGQASNTGNSAYGPTVTNGSGPFASPTGTTGLGQYNSSPYAHGAVSGTTGSLGTSPVAPAYTGSN